MEKNTQEKNLIEKNENTIFSKIKNFFRNIFSKKENKIENEVDENVLVEAEKSYEFRNYVKNIDSEENELFELQKRYRKGEIAEGDLTQEQISALCLLYDRQIRNLKKTIEFKEKQIEKYKKI